MIAAFVKRQKETMKIIMSEYRLLKRDPSSVISDQGLDIVVVESVQGKSRESDGSQVGMLNGNTFQNNSGFTFSVQRSYLIFRLIHIGFTGIQSNYHHYAKSFCILKRPHSSSKL